MIPKPSRARTKHAATTGSPHTSARFCSFLGWADEECPTCAWHCGPHKLLHRIKFLEADFLGEIFHLVQRHIVTLHFDQKAIVDDELDLA